MNTEPKPLIWLCTCGWSGTADQMTDKYECPECCGFWTLKVANAFLPSPTVSINCAA